MKNLISAKHAILLSFIVLLSLSFGCKKQYDNNSTPVNGTPGANEVWLLNSTFYPTTLYVAVNTTVKWTNKDGYAHTVTSDSIMFNSGNMGSNATYSFQFTKQGNYKYHCAIHSMMMATIVVQ
jgi:plastocyanin